MLVLFWTATPSFLHTMYGAGAPFTGHHRLEVLFKNAYCVFGAWSNVGLTILDFKEKRKVIVRLLWCMHIKKYSNSGTIQCSGQSNSIPPVSLSPPVWLWVKGYGRPSSANFLFCYVLVLFSCQTKHYWFHYNYQEHVCEILKCGRKSLSAFKTSMWMEKDKKEKGP